MNSNRSLQEKTYIISGKEQLNLLDKISVLRKKVWPDFLRLSDEIIFKVYERYPDFQISLLNEERELIGIANSIPLTWTNSFSELPNEGLNWIMDTGLKREQNIRSANTLGALSITVAPADRNQGISKILLHYLKRVAITHDLMSLIVPARPNLKSMYPLIPIEQYITWKKEGLIFDPWLRTHCSLGAHLINICHRSACITATIEQWEQWTGVKFPNDGDYVIKEALTPVKMDYMNNLGTYIEPNVWVYYPI
ncbi:N-acetyltransferase [Legionella gratiana]|nr:N-acetyltransferase [Legionella gratiana]